MKFFFKRILFFIIVSSSLCAATEPPGENKAKAIKLAKSHREFAFSLYPLLNASDANLVFSPYSIATSLAMAYLGARGETASQMETTLHLDIDRKNIAKATSDLTQALSLKKNEDKAYQLNIANALWIDQGIFLLTDFRQAIEQQFKAKLGMLNFAQKTNALSTINDWTSEQTQGKITHLLSENDINELTRFVLTNAVYFQGMWMTPFNPQATHSAPFYPTPETTTAVKMMSQVLTTPYFENDLIQAVALPFIGTTKSDSKLALLILLPKSAENFSAMFQELPDSFEDWVSALQPQHVDLKLPQFQLSNRWDLNAPLQELGLQDAFDSEANFVGIDGMRDLFLNKAIHQTFFNLDENGVTASAATAISINAKSTRFPEPPAVMNIDHPFLFFIVDLNSLEMLFMGRVTERESLK